MRNNNIYNIALSILYPFGGLLYSIRNLGKNGSRLYFVLFCMYFGLIFIYHQQGTVLGDGSDSERYAIYLSEAHKLKDINIVEYIKLYNGEKRIDYYAPTIIFIVSRITDNPHIFFAVVALLYGVFYSKFLWLIIKHSNNKNAYLLFFIIALFLIAPIWKINGVRWWTALYLFSYGTVGWILEKKNKLLFWSLCSIFVHYTFIYPLALFILYVLLPKKRILPYILLFIGINIFNNIDLTFTNNLINKLFPVNIADSTIGYLTFEYKATRNWFADSGKYFGIILNLYFVILFYLKAKDDIIKDKTLSNLFIFALLLQSLSLFINIAPWGGRFLDLGDLSIYGFYCIAISRESIFRKTSSYINYAIPFLIYIIFIHLKNGFYVINPISLLLGNYATAFVINENTSIMNIIDKLLTL